MTAAVDTERLRKRIVDLHARLGAADELRRTADNNTPSWTTASAVAEDWVGASSIGELHFVDESVGPAGDGTSVCTDTGNQPPPEPTIEPHEFEYTTEERAAIDEANEAFAPIIEAVETVEDVDHWVRPVVKGVRADEDQSIARVLRTGQEQPVTVANFLLENSSDD